MKNIKYISIITLVVSLFMSCEPDFGDTNIDPNKASIGSTSALLTSSQRYMATYTTTTTPNLYVQYLAAGDYDEESRYQGFNFNYDLEFQKLRNLIEVINLCTNEDSKTNASSNGSLNNQIAVAKLQKAFMFSTMADRWGMLPYSEGLAGLDEKFPKYDSVDDIYKGCFAEIDEALAMIDSGAGPVGDIIFKGDMDKWKTFGNTLRVIMSIRISSKYPTVGGLAETEFNKGIAGAISSNSQNISYSFLPEDNNDNPWEDRFESRKDYILADTFVNFLIGTGTNVAPEDPRLAKYGDVSESALEYAGGIYGDANNTTDFSFITKDIIKNQAAPGVIFTAAQVAFSKSEAVTLGWYSGSASTFYEEGIQTSMDQWGVASAEATTYIAAHPYTNLSDLGTQKWISLYMQGFESWAEWRRFNATGQAPTLKVITNAINGNGIPQRHAYPGSAPTLNEDAYNTAVGVQGADNIDTKLWWAQ